MATSYAGYMGKVVELDLTTREVREYPWTDEDRRKYIGGKTMAAKVLDTMLTGREEAFSEENPLIISTGPLTGTGAPCSGRLSISALSPQTGIVASSNCGGTFGYFLKKAGLDALIIRGKCDQHTWIEIDNGRFEFHSADEDGLWGLKATPSQQRIKELLEQKWGAPRSFGQMVIGPAGENLVLYSGIISDERAAGRTGLGAVMGWKNLKAIAVTGNHEIMVANPEKAAEWNRKFFRALRTHPLTGKQLPRMGTAGLVSPMQMRGMLATRNFSAGRFDGFDKGFLDGTAHGFPVAADHLRVPVQSGAVPAPVRGRAAAAADQSGAVSVAEQFVCFRYVVRGGGSPQILLSGAVVVFAVAAVLGVFSKQNGLERPKLSAVNIAGLALMVVGLVMNFLAARIADMFAREGKDVSPLVRMAGVMVCGVGAALVFI